MKLYSYFRSSTAYRVRIALALKGLKYDTIPVNLLKNEQNDPAYTKLNPMAAVPALEHEGAMIGQSLAIIDYLESIQPFPTLFPGGALEKAYARQIALSIATDIHPLINMKVLKYMGDVLGQDEAAKKDWTAHWLLKGMRAVEAMLQRHAGKFAVGDHLSIADICIVPQMYGLRRNEISLDDLPLCCAIEQRCIALKEFQMAAPETQVDAPPDLAPIHGPGSPLLKQVA